MSDSQEFLNKTNRCSNAKSRSRACGQLAGVWVRRNTGPSELSGGEMQR